MQDLRPFFEPAHFIETKEPGTYNQWQWGSAIKPITDESTDWGDAEIVIVGCGELRGDGTGHYSEGPDMVREHFYRLYNWHNSIKVADAGNIRRGATVEDTYAALLTILEEIHMAGKTALLIGGSHDLTLQQYNVFKRSEQMVNVSVIDMLVDLDESESLTSGSFLMDMFTTQPNFVGHFSHIGFQSYYAHPKMVETLDKLRFDFFRLGKVRENIEDMEPVLRNSNLLSFDIAAVRYSDAPVNINGSPNGFTGDEACLLARYAGMSSSLSSFGIYGYDSSNDTHQMTARLMSQMIWYFIDGYLVRKNEARLMERDEFIVFHVTFTDNDTTFLKSKRTNRWWMKLPNEIFVPCSYNDYLTASNDEMPERWLREQERLL